MWRALDASLDADDVSRDVSVCSEGFVLVEKTEDRVNLFANAAHMCHVCYSEDDPRAMEWAAKWYEDDGATKLILYYADRFEHYIAKRGRNEIEGFAEFTADPDFEGGKEPNPYSRIPLFHYQFDRRSEHGELQRVIPLQDAHNKLFADMMVSAEFGAWPQRWAIMVAGTQGTDLKSAPNTIMKIPYDAEATGQPSVGQFEATQLDNFLGAMNQIAASAAIVSRTPKHYFMQQGDVSGEALLAMDAPLSRKAKKYTTRLGATWRQVASFVLELSGINVAPSDITPLWEDVRTVQPLTEATVHKTNSEAGIPIETQLRMESWTAADIEAMHEDAAAKLAAMTNYSDVAREDALKRFNAGQVT